MASPLTAFTGRYSAERYLAAHYRRDYRAPSPSAYGAALARAAQQARLAQLGARARRVERHTLLGMTLVMLLAGVLRYLH